MARLRVGITICLQIRRQRGQRAAAHRDEQRIAECAKHRERVLAGSGDADRRVWLLIWPRHRTRLVEAVIYPGERKTRLRPSQLEDLQRLEEALAALRI